MSFSTEDDSMQIPAALTKLMEQSLRFEYLDGKVTPISSPHGTSWRTLPFAVTAQAVNARVELQTNGKRVLLRNDAAFFVPRGGRHNATLISAKPACSRWSHFNCWILGSVDVFSLFDVPPIFTGAAAQTIGDLNAAMAALGASLDLPKLLQRQTLGMQLVLLLIERATLKPGSLEFIRRVDRIAPALAYIDQNLGQPFGRDELAATVHLSPTRFQAVFREALGIAPRDFLQRRRLQHAQQLLLATELGVEEIARRVGMKDPFHFSRLFKKRHGSSPSAYRHQVREAGW
jgi:AraC-like DNA-binding protein